MSDASHSASGATVCQVMVQFPPLVVRGMPTTSNLTLRQSGWRSSAYATRRLISSTVAGVFAKSVSKSMSLHPHLPIPPARANSRARGLRHESWVGVVNGGLNDWRRGATAVRSDLGVTSQQRCLTVTAADRTLRRILF